MFMISRSSGCSYSSHHHYHIFHILTHFHTPYISSWRLNRQRQKSASYIAFCDSAHLIHRDKMLTMTQQNTPLVMMVDDVCAYLVIEICLRGAERSRGQQRNMYKKLHTWDWHDFYNNKKTMKNEDHETIYV